MFSPARRAASCGSCHRGSRAAPLEPTLARAMDDITDALLRLHGALLRRRTCTQPFKLRWRAWHGRTPVRTSVTALLNLQT